MTRIGSLCTGYGALDAAAAQVLGGGLAWVADNDPGAELILATRFPDIKNLGDITAVDWDAVEPVDVLCAGFPCQPVSNAGKRLGDADERWIWPAVADAVRHLRPRYVFLENVAALLTRGLDGVIASLAKIGYVGSWCCVRASGAGAPHRRERIFILARPACPPRTRETSTTGNRLESWEARRRVNLAKGVNGNGQGTPLAIAAQALLKTPTAQLAVNGGSQDPAKRRAGGHGPTLADQVEHELLPAPRTADDRDSRTAPLRDERRTGAARVSRGPDAPVSGYGPPADTDGDGCEGNTESGIRPMPGSAHHSGTTLPDVFWSGGSTAPPSAAGNESSDGQRHHQLSLDEPASG